MLKGILFDLDDTLLDWGGFHADWRAHEAAHLRGVFEYVQNSAHPLRSSFDTLLETYMERTRDAWMLARVTLRAPHVANIMTETLIGLGFPQEKLDVRRCLEVYNWCAVEGTIVFPEVPQVLEELRAHHIRVGIVTNASQPMWMRDKELEEHDLLRFFPSCRFSAADAGYLKPHPLIFQKAMACLETLPGETVFVGDNPVADIAGAQGAGLKAVLRVKQPAPPLISGLIIPDRAINSLTELLPILDEWFAGWR